ncbi:MAG: chemotaxis protein CheA [Steroidobacteraceae bacterium]
MSDDSPLDLFVTECQELLRDMESMLLRCERGDGDADVVNELFRAAHTIKGTAGLFGLDAIVAFTHVVESTLDRIRIEGSAIPPALIDVLLACGDHITALVESVAGGSSGVDPQVSMAGAALLEQLSRQTGFANAAPATTTAVAVPPLLRSPPLSSPLIPGPADGLRVQGDSWHISVRFHANVLRNGMDPLSFVRYLTTFGSITGLTVVDDALPPLEEVDPEVCYLGFEIGLKTDAPKTRIEAAFDFVRDDCTLHILPPRSLVSDYVSLIRDLPGVPARLGEMLVACGTITAAELERCLKSQSALSGTEASSQRLGELLVEQKMVQPSVVAAAVEQQKEARSPNDSKDSEKRSIRVDGDKLDRLIDLIGELIIAGAATGSEARRAGLARLNESALHLAQIVEEVRDQALKLRIVQIGPTFNRFQRVVREVARETGKEIHLAISGADTELDKTLVERIADPLTHLVRNAIDHGIEMPAIRQAQGKPGAGTVRLNAYHDAGSVVIEVSDDGAGLNRNRILDKARQRSLVSEGQELTDEQVYELIFAPGFSTAEQVTNLSGRGVGMDVVKSNVTAMRGTVEIHSEEGVGSKVRMRLPLTLAIIDGFQIGIGNSTFVIPLDLVEECVELNPAEHSETDGPCGSITLHGSVLPLIRLRDMFDVSGGAGRRQSVVVVRGAGKKAGIVVDELLGELQAVIKPLSRLFRQLRGVAGSTILGSGRVALILDVPGLIERSHAQNTRAHRAQTAGSPALAKVSS